MSGKGWGEGKQLPFLQPAPECGPRLDTCPQTGFLELPVSLIHGEDSFFHRIWGHRNWVKQEMPAERGLGAHAAE